MEGTGCEDGFRDWGGGTRHSHGEGGGLEPLALALPCGPQFWSAYTPCNTQNKDAVKRTLEQIDVIHRMCQMYPETFLCVTSSQGRCRQPPPWPHTTL